MEAILGVLLGMALMALIKKDGIHITIEHKTQQSLAPVDIPSMSQTLKNGNNAEDEVYANMGEMLDNINDIMMGGSTHGKE